jgi:hypothetical protein
LAREALGIARAWYPVTRFLQLMIYQRALPLFLTYTFLAVQASALAVVFTFDAGASTEVIKRGGCALIRCAARRLAVVVIVIAEPGRTQAFGIALDPLAPVIVSIYVPRALRGIILGYQE